MTDQTVDGLDDPLGQRRMTLRTALAARLARTAPSAPAVHRVAPTRHRVEHLADGVTLHLGAVLALG